MNPIDALKAKQAKELAALEKEETIRAALPPFLRETARIHTSWDLYGASAHIVFEGPYSGPALNLEFAARVVEALPAVATTMVRDSCLSFRTTAYVEALPEKAKERWQEETAVSPILLSIEPVTSTRLGCEWFARVADTVVRVSVRMGYPPHALGVYEAKKIEFRGGYRYEAARFRVDPSMHTVMSDDGEPIAQLESPIRWASGSDQYPNRITLYFVDLGADMDPAMVANAIIRHALKVATRTP